MSALDAFWHLVGFVTLPLLFGVLAAGAVKLLWRRPLAAVPLGRLALRATLACLAVAVAGLALTGRDGAMATWGAMVAACALTLWWPLRR